MLRATWEKTSNPYIRLLTRWDRPRVGIRKRIFLPRPSTSIYTCVLLFLGFCHDLILIENPSTHRRPITAWIYFNGTEEELARQTQLTFDIPGGGFICMTPEHHEERNLRWCIKTKRPVISFDYGKVRPTFPFSLSRARADPGTMKAPEYPFPYAIDEMYDAYKLLHDTNGKCIGMSGTCLDVILTGDSACVLRPLSLAPSLSNLSSHTLHLPAAPTSPPRC